jgi:hypothetical protein
MLFNYYLDTLFINQSFFYGSEQYRARGSKFSRHPVNILFGNMTFEEYNRVKYIAIEQVVQYKQREHDDDLAFARLKKGVEDFQNLRETAIVLNICSIHIEGGKWSSIYGGAITLHGKFPSGILDVENGVEFCEPEEVENLDAGKRDLERFADWKVAGNVRWVYGWREGMTFRVSRKTVLDQA